MRSDIATITFAFLCTLLLFNQVYARTIRIGNVYGKIRVIFSTAAILLMPTLSRGKRFLNLVFTNFLLK